MSLKKIWTADFYDDEKQEVAARISDVVRYVTGRIPVTTPVTHGSLVPPSSLYLPRIYAMEPLERKGQLEDHFERIRL